MKITLIILCAILTSCSSCKKLNIFKDEKLTLNKLEYSGNQLRTDGLYYGNTDTAWINILVLYRDGTVLLPGVCKLPELKEYFESIIRSMNVMRPSKFEWGLFNIEHNTIKIEHWLPAQGGYPTLLRTGEILNDTTFVLTKSVMRGKNVATPKDINQTFYFKHFDIKPDSTNSFIK